MSDPLEALRKRVAVLDTVYADRDDFDDRAGDEAHFVRTMQRVNETNHEGRASAPVVSTPRTADEVVAACRLVSVMHQRTRDLGIRPGGEFRQYWVAAGRPEHLPVRVMAPKRSEFVAASAAHHMIGSSKPFGLGIYTSTGSGNGLGMWWALLQLSRGSGLFPLPWSAWEVAIAPSARVFELTSAQRWVELVQTYPLEADDKMAPNWAAIADSYDAVHMTVPAIAATQGVVFREDRVSIAAPYWDVESTLWLNWVFDDFRLARSQD